MNINDTARLAAKLLEEDAATKKLTRRANADRVAKLRPLLQEVRDYYADAEKQGVAVNLDGATQWTEWVEKNGKTTLRNIQYILAGGNNNRKKNDANHVSRGASVLQEGTTVNLDKAEYAIIGGEKYKLVGKIEVEELDGGVQGDRTHITKPIRLLAMFDFTASGGELVKAGGEVVSEPTKTARVKKLTFKATKVAIREALGVNVRLNEMHIGEAKSHLEKLDALIQQHPEWQKAVVENFRRQLAAVADDEMAASQRRRPSRVVARTAKNAIRS